MKDTGKKKLSSGKEGLRKHELLRHLIQAAAFALNNGYARGFMEGKIYRGELKRFCAPGLNCYSCPGALFACPIGALQSVLDSGGFRISLYVLGFLTAAGALFGRLICGFICPFGFIQDLLYKIPVFRKIKNLPGHGRLRWLRHGILLIFVILLPMTILNEAGMGSPWFCEYICPAGTLLAGLPLMLLNPVLASAAGLRFAWKLILLTAIVLLSIKSYRPFCKYLCPLGALYGAFNPVSVYKYSIDEEACIKCGACRDACGMDIKVWEQPNSIDCIRCGRCRAACPKDAIKSGFCKR